jgi:hypothetical protein
MVAIVSQNAETLGHLRDYFETRSLKVRIHRRLLEVTAAEQAPDALILFPDEFPREEVKSGLLSLLPSLFEATVIVVTGDTQRFLLLRAQLNEAAQARLIVLPRPAFAWTLFEHVIRASSVSDTVGGF